MEAETIRGLDLLQRVAEELGAVLVLTSTNDDRLPGGGKRIHSSLTGAELRSLLIVRPNPLENMSRWHRLARGTILATCSIGGTVSLDDIATAMVERIEQARQAKDA